jgi:hypothetical protein
VFWVVVAGVIVLPHIHTYSTLSPIDEFQHVDYLDSIQHGDLVHRGDRVGETAMREQACRGIDLEGVVLPPCSTPEFDPAEFPAAGYNHTYGDPPTYYLLTAPLAVLLEALPGVHSVVTAARFIGVLWLGAGLALTFLLARRLGADRRAAVGATLMIASAPVVVHTSATVTTDAPSLLVGAVLSLTALAVAEQRIAWPWLAGGAALATAFKVTSLTVVGAVFVFFLLRAVVEWTSTRSSSPIEHEPLGHPSASGSPSRRWASLLPAAAVLVGALVPILAWSIVTSATSSATVDEMPIQQQFAADSIGWTEIARNFFNMFSPLIGAYIPTFMATQNVITMGYLVNILLLSALVGLAWCGPIRDVAPRIAASTAASMLLSPSVFVIMLFVTLHVHYGIPARYGLSLLPASAACLAVVASTRRGGGTALLAIAGVGMLVLLSTTL